MRYLIPVALLVVCTSAATAQELQLETVPQKASYMIGRNIGREVANPLVPFDIDALLAGIRDSMTAEDSKVSEEEAGMIMQAFQEIVQTRMQEYADENKEHLVKNAEREEVTQLESGLQYEVLKEGTGETPTAQDRVECHYTGTLIDGTVFDSTQDGESAPFPVNRVIPGWTEALQLMKVGGKWKLHIPSELAYGQEGNGPIPPHSTLIFEIELVNILEQTQPQQPQPQQPGLGQPGIPE